MGLDFNNVSRDDVDAIRNMKNKPSYDAGDLPSGGDASFDGLMGGGDDFNLDDIFGDDSSGSDILGGNGSSQSDSQSNVFNTITNSNNGMTQTNQYNQGFIGYNQQAQVQQKPDYWDKTVDFTVDGLRNSGKVLIELFKSLKNRTADDIGYYGSRMLKTGMIGIAVSVAFALLALISKINFISINGISGTMLLSFGLTTSTGAIAMGLSAYFIARTNKDSVVSMEGIPDASVGMDDDATDDYEDELGDIMADLFGDDSDDIVIDLDDNNNITENIDDRSELANMGPSFNTPQNIDFSKLVDQVEERGVLTRQKLVEIFLKFLPTNNPDFAVSKKLDSNSDEFTSIEANCLKALSNILKCEVSEVDSYAMSISETFFAYEIRMKRIKGLNKTDDLANELLTEKKVTEKDPTDHKAIWQIAEIYFVA